MLFKFFKKRFWVLLVIIVLISYGQMLGMQPWEDDNALFFKLAHIQEPVGFFGAGPLGEGVYRYAAVPFIPIYKFFGFYTPSYFALLILLYMAATLAVYKTFSFVLGKTGGRIAGLVYGAGYITSDSFWRMANSATTSISVILISAFFYFYWRYFKKTKARWYLATLVVFLLSLQIAVARTHYLFAVAVLFELIFLAFKKPSGPKAPGRWPIKSLLFSVVRLIPFFFVFTRIVVAGDTRSSVAKDFVISVTHGDLYKTYGFLSSFANLVIPDWLTSYLPHRFLSGAIILLIISSLALVLVFKKNKNRKVLIPAFICLSGVWIYLSKTIFTTPFLKIGGHEFLIASLGGLLGITFVAALFALKKGRSLFLFLGAWLVVNIAAYSAYFPTLAYDTTNRYLAHSFFAYAGLLGFTYSVCQKEKKRFNFLGISIFLLVFFNLYEAVLLQRNILTSRSYPVREFYGQLTKILPKIEKGDLLYFDVASERSRNFRDAISAAMMPDSGSFAWRYGVDRYDFHLVSSFEEFNKIYGINKLKQEQVFSFWYSKEGLKETTSETRSFLSQGSQNEKVYTETPNVSTLEVSSQGNYGVWVNGDLTINLEKPLVAVHPNKLNLVISATAFEAGNFEFPLMFKKAPGNYLDSFWTDDSLSDLAFGYKRFLDSYYENSEVETSSDWQDRVKNNLVDDDDSTVWQSDRTAWTQEATYLRIDLGRTEAISGIAWVPGSRNNFPIKYQIEVSIDGNAWEVVKEIEEIPVGVTDVQRVDFKKTNARFVKMMIEKTLGEDSPMISEFRVIPRPFSELDSAGAEDFLNNPFLYIPSRDSFLKRTRQINYIGTVQAYWFGDKEGKWITDKASELKIIYDGRPHVYTFTIPAGGTRIDSINLTNFKIPGELRLESLYLQ